VEKAGDTKGLSFGLWFGCGGGGIEVSVFQVTKKALLQWLQQCQYIKL